MPAATYPANLTTPCAPIPPFEGDTSDDLISDHLNLIDIYRDCSTRHAGLAESVQ